MIPSILSVKFFEGSNSRKRTIVLGLLITDIFAISLSAATAYIVRFSETSNIQGALPSIAQFDYRGILFLVAISWILILTLTGTYNLTHADLMVLNLRLIMRRSVVFFLLLGFISFILRASFSRIVFLTFLMSGMIYLFIFRVAIYFLVLRPLILKKQVTSNLMIVGRNRFDLQSHSDWLIKNRSFGFSVVSRLECKEITKDWIEEFDRILHFRKIDEILLLPGMETDPNFSRFIHYCEDLNLHVNWIPLDSGNLGYWLIPTQQEGIPFLTFEIGRAHV